MDGWTDGRMDGWNAAVVRLPGKPSMHHLSPKQLPAAPTPDNAPSPDPSPHKQAEGLLPGRLRAPADHLCPPGAVAAGHDGVGVARAAPKRQLRHVVDGCVRCALLLVAAAT